MVPSTTVIPLQTVPGASGHDCPAMYRNASPKIVSDWIALQS